MIEVTVIVKDGMVIEVLSDATDLSVKVLDLDTTDPDMEDALLDQLVAEHETKHFIC